MPSKKKPTTLPEILRKLADEIDQLLSPRRGVAPEELIASGAAGISKLNFKALLKARRKAVVRAETDEDTDGDEGGEGAPTAPPLPPPPRRPGRR